MGPVAELIVSLCLGEVKSFLGNQTHSDHFKLLRQDGGSLLIGARNIVYNISLPDLQVQAATRASLRLIT
jgi:hypothetical protein